MQISFILPVLNERAEIVDTLSVLQPYRKLSLAEVIMVDGGSEDGTVELAEPLCDKVLQTTAGRALQMNAGAAQAQGDWLLFLHADTRLPPEFASVWRDLVERSSRGWGRFDLELSGRSPLFRLIESMINLRSRITGIATGDQAIFVRRNLFHRVGGYATIPLMEDVELSRRLKKESRPLSISARLITSSRHWEQRGILRTVYLMWKLRLLYFFGVSPERLVKRYYCRSYYNREQA